MFSVGTGIKELVTPSDSFARVTSGSWDFLFFRDSIDATRAITSGEGDITVLLEGSIGLKLPLPLFWST